MTKKNPSNYTTDTHFHSVSNPKATSIDKKFKLKYIIGQTGSTWDAKHLNNFLCKSNYSNWKEI
jgi:hypothetical protein